jgi:hypothetical protein
VDTQPCILLQEACSITTANFNMASMLRTSSEKEVPLYSLPLSAHVALVSALWADVQGRGGSTGYDIANGLQARAEAEELEKENIKRFTPGTGRAVFSVAKVCRASLPDVPCARYCATCIAVF